MGNKLVLIDGHSILNRAFYGVPELTNSEGLHTNAVYGFLNILFKILDEEKANYLMVAFDVSAPTFRHEMFTEYKGTRKGMPDELREQVPLMKELLHAMGVKIMEQPGYEADDILGTLAKQAEKEGLEVSVVSGDRDLLQLASEHIKIRIPKTKRGTTEIEDYFDNDVVSTYQVTPLQFIDLKALMGDASDNIPGVPGIGEKTASKIIAEFGSIENAYQNIEQVMPNKARESLREHYDLAQLSKVLATIELNAPIDISYEEGRLDNMFTQEAYLLMKRLEFKSILTRFQTTQTAGNEIEEKFKIVSGRKDAEQIFKKASSHKHIGIDFIEDGTLLGSAISFSADDIYYIPVKDDVDAAFLSNHAMELVQNGVILHLVDLKPQLKYLRPDYDNKILDAEIAGYLLNPLKDTYHYDDIARDYLGMTVPSREDLLAKTSLRDASLSKAAEFLKFACYAAYIAYASYEPLMEQLQQTGMKKLFDEIEMPLVFTLYHMEQAGIKVEKDALKQYGDELAEKIVAVEHEIYETVGEKFNINSPKQLGEILFDKLKLPGAKKTKTGYSTSADVLEKLAEDYPVIHKILEYRQLTKLKSTYADGLANYIGDDNRIRSKFNQTIAATGRISSTEPNLQNIPIRMELGRAIRKVFVPEDGFIFVDADYSQIELRVLAHISGDERLIEAYSMAEDIHKITASQVFHTPLEEVTSLQRSNAKAVNFGIVYGISSFGLSQGLSISRKEAAEYIKQYFTTYPRIKQFLDDTVQAAKDTGYSVTMFGRRRPVPELRSSNFMQRSFGERIAMNSPIQGSAADIIKIAMVRVDQRLKQQNMQSRLILQVHDELLVEAKLEETEQVKQILEEEMHGAADLKVSLEIDMHQGGNWFEAK